jgi:hypothetical protein
LQSLIGRFWGSRVEDLVINLVWVKISEIFRAEF